MAPFFCLFYFGWREREYMWGWSDQEKEDRMSWWRKNMRKCL